MWGLIFPGQGSQAPGMGSYLYENFKPAKECFEEASDALSLDMKKLCFQGGEEELALTENTQPALLTVSIATHRVLADVFGLRAAACAGHSVGEYAALVSAKAMKFSQAVCAVRKRGQAMQSAVPVGQGGMLAVIGPTSQEVRELCAWAVRESGLGPLSPANYNSPQQTVVSGAKKVVDWLHENIKSYAFASAPKRVMTIPLKVSAPFHCEMMKPAEDEMAVVLNALEFSDASPPVVQNITAEPVTEASELRNNLVRQITGSVRWVETIECLSRLGVTRFVECGTGKILAGLNKKIGSEITTLTTADLEELKALEEQIRKA